MKPIPCSLFVSLLAVNCIQAADVPFVELKGHTARVSFAIFSPDGKRVVSSSQDDTFRIWDAESGKELKKLELRAGTTCADAFSPDGKKFLVSGRGMLTVGGVRSLRFLDAESGEELKTLRLTLEIDSAIFSPDGTKISAGGHDRKNYTAHILDAESGKELHRFVLPDTSVYRGTFSPDGTKIITRTFRDDARIWDVESGKALHILKDADDVAFSPDGTKIVTGHSSRIEDKYYSRGVNFFRIWDVESGKELHKFTVLQGGSGSADFSPDGKKLVTVVNSIVRIRDVATGEELLTLTGAEGGVVFSPDGKKMVAAGKGHTVIIWDAESGKELQRLQLDPNSRADVGNYFISLISYDPMVSSITFSPDGKRVVTASNDGCVRVWTLE